MKKTLLAISLLLATLSTHAQDYELSGFFDIRGGTKVESDVGQEDSSLSEGRLQIEVAKSFDLWEVNLKSDLISDAVTQHQAIDLEKNSGWLQLREANITYFPTDIIEFKIGRQILTWGTGDLVFINDLFPKDWKSFFSGRDNEYLKSPSDALKTSLFFDWINIDIIYTPRFDPDKFIDGQRFSYYSPNEDTITAQKFEAVILDDWLTEDEFSLRLYGQKKSIEWAIYAYHGYWKTPKGFDATQNKPTFNALSEVGFSIRTNFLKGIINAEAGYYLSRDDTNGEDPFVPNSQVKFLLGYEQEIIKDLTASIQYYAEWTQNYDEHITSIGGNQPEHPKETRHLLTLRITKLLMKQNLNIGFFTFWSPNEQDVHARLKVSYKINDHWKINAGANYFAGDQASFFGQFQENNNIYMGARYYF